MRLTFMDWLRDALSGGVRPEPAPESVDALAQRHARTLVDVLTHDPDHFEVHADGAGHVYHVDLSPAAEDLIALRIKAALEDDRAGRAQP